MSYLITPNFHHNISKTLFFNAQIQPVPSTSPRGCVASSSSSPSGSKSPRSLKCGRAVDVACVDFLDDGEGVGSALLDGVVRSVRSVMSSMSGRSERSERSERSVASAEVTSRARFMRSRRVSLRRPIRFKYSGEKGRSESVGLAWGAATWAGAMGSFCCGVDASASDGSACCVKSAGAPMGWDARSDSGPCGVPSAKTTE
jgi:hypothetical protein